MTVSRNINEPGGTDADAAGDGVFRSAEWYDRGINWDARLRREIPLLCDVFGPPAAGGILDAGCGTGRQAIALAERGYTVTGIDASEPMVDFAARLAAKWDAKVSFECCPYQDLADRFAGAFDGIFCIGNALASAGSEKAVEQAVRNFGAVLRPGGRLFLQVLNFPLMRRDSPCVRGPRVANVGGVEYVSVRLFQFVADPSAGRQGRADVTNITVWRESTWCQRSHCGTLYPVTQEELTHWYGRAGLNVLETLGAYDRSPFDPEASTDLILIGEKTA
jgi:SAM-dependent methyltransferase